MSDKTTNNYIKIVWENYITKLNQENMNHLEEGIYNAMAEAENATGRLNEYDAETIPSINNNINSNAHFIKELETLLLENYYSKEDFSKDINPVKQISTTKDGKILVENLEGDSVAKEVSALYDDKENKISDTYAKKSSLPSKISELENDSNFVTNTVGNLINYYLKTETYTKEEIHSLLTTISTLSILPVDSLPTENISTSTIYLLKVDSEDNTNTREEYLYVNGKWEIIGTTKVDLSNFYTKDESDSKYATKSQIPTKTSDLTNDSNYLSKETISTLNGVSLTEGGNVTTKDISVNETKQLFTIGSGGKGLSINYEFMQSLSANTGTQRSAAYGNGYFVMAGSGGNVQYSSDKGKTWTAVTRFADASSTLTGLAYGNGIFVLVEYISGTSGKIWVTDIPTNEWKNVYTFEGYSLENVRYINNEFVAVGTNGLITKSNDGKNWTVVHEGGASIIDIAYGDGKYVAAGGAGTVLISVNGTTWYDNTIADYTSDIRCISYANGTFVIGTQGGRIDWSVDGITWTQANNPSEYDIRFIRNFAYGDNRLYVCMYSSASGKGQVWLSNDKGRTWEVALTVDKYLWTICFAEDTFVTGGNSGYVYNLDLGLQWQETNPGTDVIYYKNVIIQNDGSKTESDVYSQANSLSLVTYRTSAPQSEWFRIAKVKDINTSGSGIFTFNIYGLNDFTGLREILSSDIFSIAYSWQEDKYISDVLSIAHSQTDDATASGGSNAVSMGMGLTAIRLERYKDEVYICGLIAISSVEDYAVLDIDMLIENNINLSYIDELKIVYFENEYQTEYPLLEGTVLEPDTNYAIKLQTTYQDFNTAMSTETNFLVEALDSTGDMGSKTFLELTWNSERDLWELNTCSPKIDTDESTGEKIPYRFSNGMSSLFKTFNTYYITLTSDKLSSILNDKSDLNYGQLVSFFADIQGMSTTIEDYFNYLDNDYCTTRVKKYSFTLEYVGDTTNTEYKAVVTKNDVVVGEVTSTSTTLNIEVTSVDDIITIIEENSDGANNLSLTLDPTNTILEIEVPYKESIPLYVDALATVGNDIYNFGFTYQEYFPHEISKSYLMASVYRNLIDINKNMSGSINELYYRINVLENGTFEYYSLSEALSIKYIFKNVYNKFCVKHDAIEKSFAINVKDAVSNSVIKLFIVSILRTSVNGSAYRYKTVITLMDIETFETYQYVVENLYWTDEIKEVTDYTHLTGLSNYTLKTDTPTKTSELTNDSNFITSEDLNNSITRNNLISIIGEATTALSGLMSSTDKERLDTLVALLKDDDDNTIVDTIAEVLAIFNQYPEGADLVSALALKADKKDIPTDYVDLNSTQNIAGAKSFSRSITRGPKQEGQTGYVDIGSNSTPFDRGYITYLNAPISMVTFKPQYDDSKDLGASNSRWRDLYLSGVLTDNTNSIAIADIASKNDIPTFKTINGESIVGEGDIKIEGGSGGETRPLKEYVQAGITEKQLEPNKYYIFDSQVASNLTITLAEEDDTYLDEFIGEIKVDETAINITFPSNIRWGENSYVINSNGTLTLEAKNTYLFSVANSLGLITNIPNPSLAEAVYTISGSVISWEEVANATLYDVYNGKILLVENTTSTSVDMSAYLTDAGEYIIKVISKSNYYVDSITTITYYITAPLSAPTNLVLSDTGTLSWDAVENAESYEVYETEGGTLLKTVTVNYIDLTTITTLTGTYTIKVKAINTTSPNVYIASELSEGVSYTWG